MSLDWVTWSHPVGAWWLFLVAVSLANIALWFVLYRQFRTGSLNIKLGVLRVEVMLLLCASYVFGCAFRSVLPRADVQRICLFDTWLSSVMIGRTVATVAEVAFVVQWALILHWLGVMTGADTILMAAWLITPLILIAEC